MTDKTCRLQILEALRSLYEREPYAWADNDALARECRMDINVLERNVKYLKEKGLAKVHEFQGHQFNAQITAGGLDFLAIGQPAELAIQSPINIQQVFHGPVGGVAGRDINIQVSFNEVLTKLSETAEADRTMPTEEKTLLEKLKSLAGNSWIQSVGTSVLAEIIKKSVGI